MRRLEAKLGISLLLRSTRSTSPTEAGLALVQRLRPAFDEIDLGLVELDQRKGGLGARVRINVHRNAAETLIIPRLRRLLHDHPGLNVELVLDDGLTDVVASGCDGGVRNGERLAKDMVAVRISGDHLEGRASLATPEDLGEHCCIAYRFVTSRALHRWRFAKGVRDLEAVFEPFLIVDDILMARRAALEGLGLCYVVHDAVVDDLRSGALVEVLADWSVTVAGDFLYYPSRRTLSPGMRILVEDLRWR